MINIDDCRPPAPRLPQRQWTSTLRLLAISAGLHLAAATTIAAFAARAIAVGSVPHADPAAVRPLDVTQLVFIAREPLPSGGGGGGGGNRQYGPIRLAQSVGHDKIALRSAKPARPAIPDADAALELPSLPRLILDAKPLASGSYEQMGLPTGGVSFGTSTGPGSGGGVGEGVGIGIGSGEGPGLGPGSGGGLGGGVYRPGGTVTPPRLITEVRPAYTPDALRRRIQGAVVLELIVTRDGRPSNIRVVRSLDGSGLDEQATIAASQWRFEPGRLAGAPVDVQVTVILDFAIR